MYCKLPTWMSPSSKALCHEFFYPELSNYRIFNLVTILGLGHELSNLRIIIFHKKSRKQVFFSRCSVGPKTKFENSKIRDKKKNPFEDNNSLIR